MIYTVTFNPCLDYTMHLPALRVGGINRSSRESCRCGGKGINVSLMLHELGLRSVALGFIGGFSGDELERQLRECGVDTDFVRLSDGMTRINVKLRSGSTVSDTVAFCRDTACGDDMCGDDTCRDAARQGARDSICETENCKSEICNTENCETDIRNNDICETDINGAGPQITPAALDALLGRLDTLCAGDVLVLSGSVPPSMPCDSYLRLLRRLDGRGIRTVLDASGELLRSALEYSPYLIKPNSDELGELFGVKLDTPESCLVYARRLQEAGARNVLVSMGGDGSVLLTEDGTALRAPALRGRTVNTVGAGDSMVAGFLAGLLDGGDFRRALSLGTAAGAATAFSDGLGRGDDVAELLDRVEVFYLS